MDDTAVITLYGTSWCGGSRRARLVLERRKIPFRFVDIDEDEEAARLVEKLNHGYRSVPTLVFPDGTTLTEPSDAELRRKLGIPTDDNSW